MTLLTHPTLVARLTYSPETGEFHRNDNGRRAGGFRNDGYRQIYIDNERIVEHRLAWFYMTGEWPGHSVDHINGNRGDNRFSNLRLATQSQNIGSSRISKANTSGFKGVSWDRSAGRWMAYIMVDRRFKNLGRYDTAEEASAAYRVAAVEAFGEFARFE